VKYEKRDEPLEAIAIFFVPAQILLPTWWWWPIPQNCRTNESSIFKERLI